MEHPRQINPARLKHLLDKCPLSQKQLADRIGVDVGTLSRWKQGKQTRLTSAHLATLCNELNTTPTELCADGPLPETTPVSAAATRGQVTLMLDTACRNALALVARRYGVSRQQIVEVAPLLFLIMAEQSLAERGKALNAHEQKLGEIERSAPTHLISRLHAPFDVADQDLLNAERLSIEKRDLFAADVGSWDEKDATDNPFAKFLSQRLSETAATHEKVVNWGHDDAPRYRIGLDELVAFLGRDKEACRLVLDGKVALAEMPGDARKGTPQDRASWVKEKATQNTREVEAALDDFMKTDLSTLIAESHAAILELMTKPDEQKFDL